MKFQWCLYFSPDKTGLPLDTNKVIRFLNKENFPADKARKLGGCLDIPQGRLSTFKTNHPNDADGELMDVINYWIDNDGEASWERLATALEECHHTVIAKKIRSKSHKLITRLLLQFFAVSGKQLRAVILATEV